MSKNPENNIVYSCLGSSNHSEGERQENDYYATDPIFINLLLEKEPWLKNTDLKILEPCAGENILVDRFYDLTGNKMDSYDLISRRDDVIAADYFTTDFKDKYDIILTNPPYLKDSMKTNRGMADMINKMLDDVKIGGSVILFLKTLHLESNVRYEKIYKKNPPSKLWVFAKRICCYKNANFDSAIKAVSYTIFMWTNKKPDGSFDKNTQIGWINTESDN